MTNQVLDPQTISVPKLIEDKTLLIQGDCPVEIRGTPHLRPAALIEVSGPVERVVFDTGTALSVAFAHVRVGPGSSIQGRLEIASPRHCSHRGEGHLCVEIRGNVKGDVLVLTGASGKGRCDVTIEGDFPGPVTLELFTDQLDTKIRVTQQGCNVTGDSNCVVETIDDASGVAAAFRVTHQSPTENRRPGVPTRH